MLFLQCLSSVADWTVWKHADDTHTERYRASLHVDIMTASIHSVSSLHSTPLTLRLKHTHSCAWVTRVMRRRYSTQTTVPVPGLKGAGERISCIFSARFQPWIHILQRALFLQASCQTQSSMAHGCAVKAGKEKGDTGHCNEHLLDVSH